MSDPAESFRVGLTGTGRISDICLKTIKGFAGIEITACGSLNMDESRAKAAASGDAAMLASINLDLLDPFVRRLRRAA